jgi:hypothetical protein
MCEYPLRSAIVQDTAVASSGALRRVGVATDLSMCASSFASVSPELSSIGDGSSEQILNGSDDSPEILKASNSED